MQDGTPIIIKRKKARAHAHHGGAWKVAYADFVTAMMAFFMVMWILSLSDNDRQLVQAYFEDPTGFSKRVSKGEQHIMPWQTFNKKKQEAEQGNAELRDEMKARQEVQDVRTDLEEQIKEDPELKALFDQQAISMKVTAEGLEIALIESEMNGEVFFVVGSAVVRPQAVMVIAKIAPILAETNRALVVEGHTDSRPYVGSGYDNFNLSYDRADAVRRLLLGGGVADGQIEGIKAFADKKPRLPNDPAHFSNRRVTILLPFSTEQADRIDELPSSKLRESIQGVFRRPSFR
jgi:chemotaxis protein MotB